MREPLVLAAALFSLGLAGVLWHRNVIRVLVSLEIMLNAAGLALVAAGAEWRQPDGQVMLIFLLATTAVEVSIGLALVLRIFRLRKTLDLDSLGRSGG